jgi:hypothetical protein
MTFQHETSKPGRQKITFLSFLVEDFDETKSALMTKKAAQMNLAVLGSVGGVGVEICEPQVAKIKQ